MKTYISTLNFNKLTGLYKKLIKCIISEKEVKNALIEQAEIQPEEHILDFGCGKLTLSLMMKQQHPKAFITGVDVDNKVLAIAENKKLHSGLNIRIDKYDGGFLPYPDNTFDKVVSSFVFHQLSTIQKKQAIKEIFRVLNSDGEIHIADWGKPSNLLLEVLFFFLRLFKGVENTSVNRKGELLEFVMRHGFSYTFEGRKYDTLFGTIRLIKARK